jgi:hypothetical protein
MRTTIIHILLVMPDVGKWQQGYGRVLSQRRKEKLQEQGTRKNKDDIRPFCFWERAEVRED